PNGAESSVQPDTGRVFLPRRPSRPGRTCSCPHKNPADILRKPGRHPEQERGLGRDQTHQVPTNARLISLPLSQRSRQQAALAPDEYPENVLLEPSRPEVRSCQSIEGYPVGSVEKKKKNVIAS